MTQSQLSRFTLTAEQQELVRQGRRIVLSPEQQEYLDRAREQAAHERPEMLEQFQRMKKAASEATLSGTLRRATHRSGLDIDTMASRIEVSADLLCDFLEGSGTLPSDVLDRLAHELGLHLADAHRV